MTTEGDASTTHWLAFFPVELFTVGMGMAGLTLALRAAEASLGLPGIVSTAVLCLTLILFSSILVLYLVKAIRYPQYVLQEWNHPVKLAYFPAASITLLLLAAAILAHSEPLARAIWLVAALVQLVLTLAVISGWISTRPFQHGHLTPAWFIPVVGNVIAPVAGIDLGYIEISWFFMSIGLLFWMVLLSLVMNRLIFHDPLPKRLQPTLVVLIAPPAIAFVAWTEIAGGVDAFARLLLNAAYLFTLIVAVQLPRILRLSFSLSFWALSFPFAAVTTASFIYAREIGSAVHFGIAMGLLSVLVIIIMGLLVRTLSAICRKEVFHPE